MRAVLVAQAVRVLVDGQGRLAVDEGLADPDAGRRLSATELTAELSDAPGLWDGSKYTTKGLANGETKKPLATEQVQSILDWVGTEMDQVRGLVLDSLEKSSSEPSESGEIESGSSLEQGSSGTTWAVPEYMGKKLNADVKLLTTLLQESSRALAIDSDGTSDPGAGGAAQAEPADIEEPPAPLEIPTETLVKKAPDVLPPNTTSDPFHPHVVEKIDPILAWGLADETAWINEVASQILHCAGPMSHDWTSLWQAVSAAPQHDEFATEGPGEADSTAKFDLRLRLSNILRKVAANKMVNSEEKPGAAELAIETEEEKLEHPESLTRDEQLEMDKESLQAHKDEEEEDLATNKKTPMEKDGDFVDGLKEEGQPQPEDTVATDKDGATKTGDKEQPGAKEGSEERAQQDPNTEGNGPPADEPEEDEAA